MNATKKAKAKNSERKLRTKLDKMTDLAIRKTDPVDVTAERARTAQIASETRDAVARVAAVVVRMEEDLAAVIAGGLDATRKIAAGLVNHCTDHVDALEVTAAEHEATATALKDELAEARADVDELRAAVRSLRAKIAADAENGVVPRFLERSVTLLAAADRDGKVAGESMKALRRVLRWASGQADTEEVAHVPVTP